MFKFLFKNLYNVEPDYFGLDLSDESFKFVQLKRSGSGLDVSCFGFAHIEDGLMERGEIKNFEKLAETLKEGFKNPQNGRLTSKYVVCSLPEEHSFIRLLQLPKMSYEEAKEAIRWEIEQNIPLGIDEVYFDWQVIESADSKLDHQDVLIAAIPKSIADSYVELLKSIGLIPIAMEVESVSITRSVIKNVAVERPTLVVDIGAIRTNFIIFSGKSIRFVSSISVAGNKMIDALMSGLSVDKDGAKEIFYNIGFNKKIDKDGKVEKALTPIVLELSSQIQNYLSFYTSHLLHDHKEKEKQIEKIILSGGVANLYGITTHLASHLKIPVELANPWTNILKEPLNEIPDLSFHQSLRFTTAIGLGLRGKIKSK